MKAVISLTKTPEFYELLIDITSWPAANYSRRAQYRAASTKERLRGGLRLRTLTENVTNVCGCS